MSNPSLCLYFIVLEQWLKRSAGNFLCKSFWSSGTLILTSTTGVHARHSVLRRTKMKRIELREGILRSNHFAGSPFAFSSDAIA